MFRSRAQLHKEILRANNFAAEEPPPASFTWLRNVLRSLTHETLCDTGHDNDNDDHHHHHHLPTNPPPPNPSTLNHLYFLFLRLRRKNIDGKNLDFGHGHGRNFDHLTIVISTRVGQMVKKSRPPSPPPPKFAQLNASLYENLIFV